MDSRDAIGHIRPMPKLLVFGLFLLLAACSGDPRSFGITGPGTQPAPVAAPSSTDTNAVPGVPTSGSYYGPSTTPVTGSSGFWGYN